MVACKPLVRQICLLQMHGGMIVTRMEPVLTYANAGINPSLKPAKPGVFVASGDLLLLPWQLDLILGSEQNVGRESVAQLHVCRIMHCCSCSSI